ncbi:LLM class F420-dependent oxidoreductase [Mycobacterium sp. Aquia_213]|uniref:LLM class F420-dependent oxidoreductase n=1 Tax=Mycobacterium sp. Aquia_213 TaxID=2991728 RepID=UPI0022713DD6|nr:LLM class F420-dependent oxidoreductase [Mycobacterium sp. Aquia_213]WAC90153.1 LLM class F420-dependent oxidoreductase [Mycobacterium sp. Aquia_213]
MKFGITLARANSSLWPELTQRADNLGFESVWIPEHLVLPVQMAGSPHKGDEHPPIPPQTPVFDALNYLSFLAGTTQNIRFGTQVYNIGLRHPFISARAAATLDIVSDGRFEFGVGASWLREEWDATQLDFATRGARIDETLQVCFALWTEPVVSHHGRFFDFDEVMFEPKPVQPGGPPIHVGGDGAAALRRVARYGDGWLPMNHTLDMLPASLQKLGTLWDEQERSGRPQISIGLPVESTDDVRRLADAGIDRLIIAPWQRTSGALDGISRFADEIIGRL